MGMPASPFAAAVPAAAVPAAAPVRGGLHYAPAVSAAAAAAANAAAAAASAPLQHRRVFYEGQWVDCLDTVGQFIEATIMAVNTAQRTVRVHYNGYSTSWDEVSCREKVHYTSVRMFCSFSAAAAAV
jgi:hypothetical protein